MMKLVKRLSDDARNPTGFFYPDPTLCRSLFLICSDATSFCLRGNISVVCYLR